MKKLIAFVALLIILPQIAQSVPITITNIDADSIAQVQFKSEEEVRYEYIRIVTYYCEAPDTAYNNTYVDRIAEKFDEEFDNDEVSLFTINLGYLKAKIRVSEIEAYKARQWDGE